MIKINKRLLLMIGGAFIFLGLFICFLGYVSSGFSPEAYIVSDRPWYQLFNFFTD
ncbi:hypothetical protein [Enterococcus gallinarum]|uniref:hypothetical protein n=1 Tax=Enterococcus gallinarum TaxID=1353 RepID=UPI003D35B3BB